MKIRLQDGLPLVSATVEYGGQSLELQNVLIDTGSSGTMLPTDQLLEIGVQYEPDDQIQRIRGVGGSEFVFIKKVDALIAGTLKVKSFPVQVGAMDYGFSIDGILGMDFLLKARAVIDLVTLEVRQTA